MLSPRTQARRFAALALYQWKLSGTSPAEITRHFFDDPEWLNEVEEALSADAQGEANTKGGHLRYDKVLFEQLVNGVPKHVKEIDARLDVFLRRPISQVDPVELSILRLGAYEMLFAPSMPAPVIINEAVDLAKLLGSHNGHRHVNGVLDKLSRALGTIKKTGSG